MTEVEQPTPPQNGLDMLAAEEDDSSKVRPADIEQDMREMERRKRVEAIMSSKLFREELERIVDSARDGGTSGILQQLSDIVGIPMSRVGSMFRGSSCLLPINDIRGVESMGYAKGEKILRCKLAATFRLLDLYGWTQGLGAQITARLKVDQEYFLVNPYGLLYNEITASALNKVDMQGQIVEQGTTNFGINKTHFVLHSVVHAARPDIRCAIYIGCSPVVAIASTRTGLLPITKDACVLGEVTTYAYTGYLFDEEERNKLVRNLGPNSKVMLLTNHGALCCGETIEEAFFAACHIVRACETQLKLLPVGVDNLVLIPEETRKTIYEHARRPPEDLDKKHSSTAAAAAVTSDGKAEEDDNTAKASKVVGVGIPKWRVGGAEFEALMRMLDNAGFRTGYIYRHPLVKSEPPKPKNDVELPPAVSSLGYLLEEEELFRQGIWKRGDFRKGGDRSRWLNSPNVYQKVEVLETGTPDPKKITKWVAEGSPTHSTPVRIEDPLQFVPVNTNPKEFKRVQQQIKDNRRADKISAGPQSHILDGVTWDEANRIKDATVSSAGDHVVLVGAASKGIIQRNFQHNATVYKAPYAKNPFDSVTDDELNEYKRTVERKKKSIHGEYTDTDFSESEALSSQQTSGAQQQIKETTTTTTTTAVVSQSEPEDMSEHQVMRIQTQQAPTRSQPEVVLSDDAQELQELPFNQDSNPNQNQYLSHEHSNELINDNGNDTNNTESRYWSPDVERLSNASNRLLREMHAQKNRALLNELTTDSLLFQRQRDKFAAQSTSNDNDYSTPYMSFVTATGGGVGSGCTPVKANTYSCTQLCNALPYYTTSTNTLPTNGDDFSAGYIYDYITPQTVYKKSTRCCTPVICEAILDSIQKPKSNVTQPELIWNIPFCQQTPCSDSTLSTPEKYYNMRRTRVDFSPKRSRIFRSVDSKSHSPYRTVSHFGFNLPQEPQPEHKHIPPSISESKYIPLRRSISYEEIFASPRYLELCEHCFEQLVRLKPELIHYCTKLRNLAEYQYYQPDPALNSPSSTLNTVCLKLITLGSGAGNESSSLILNSNKDNAELVDNNNESNAIGMPFNLEPLLEVEERESSDDLLCSTTTNAPKNQIPKSAEASIFNSTFIDKLTRLNFSTESENALQQLPTPNTLPQFERKENKEKFISKQLLLGHIKALNLNSSVNQLEVEQDSNELNPNNALENCVNITEILEFGNWLDINNEQVQEDENENLKTVHDHAHNTAASTEAQPEAALTEMVNEDHSVAEELETNVSRHLMDRSERSRRKLEFQELWEDHVACCDVREQALRDNAYSDTESAIDETQLQQQQQQQNFEHSSSAPSQMDGAEEERRNFVDAEIFHGRSIIQTISPRNQVLSDYIKQTNDVCDSISQQTFDVSEPSTSNENLLHRSCATTNFAPNFTQDHEIDNKVKTLPDNKCDDLDNLPGARSTLGYKPSFQIFELYAQQPQDGGLSSIHNERLDKNENYSQMKSFSNLTAEFENILPDDIDSNSTVSTDFEDIVQKVQNLQVKDKSINILSPDPSNFNTAVQEANDYNKENENDSRQFSPMERKILEKIELNQLNKSEEIFDKIENSIRNKMMPSKLESIIKQNMATFNASTPQATFGDHGYNYRKSRSLTPLRDNSPLTSDPFNVNASTSAEHYDKSTTLPPLHTSRDIISPKVSKSSFSTTPKMNRNFILENIRNASKPRPSSTTNLKRLQGINLAGYGKNNSASVKYTTSTTSTIIKKSTSSTITSKPNGADNLMPSDATVDVYSFQSKLVKGSPKFWVSLSNSPARALLDTPPSPKHYQKIQPKRRRQRPKQQKKQKTNNETATDAENTSSSSLTTVVDVEINALGEEIQQIQPRLENYKRKVEDFGDRVAKCARNMDECVATQQDIINEHAELRETILLNQCVESVTISISQTKD